MVVCTYNRADSLKDCLEALSKQTYPHYEVIVVDDGSTDGTAEVAKGYEKTGVRYLRQENMGASAARNAGAMASGGEVICFTDDDGIPYTDWVEKMAAAFEDRQVSGVGGRVVYTMSDRPMTFLERFMRMWDPYNGKGEVYLGGLNAAFRRDVFERLGGYDENMRVAEDIDLYLRFRESGRNPTHAPKALVYHKTRGSLMQLIRQFFVYGRGSYMLHRRYPGRYGFVQIFAVRFGSILMDAARTPLRVALSPNAEDRIVYVLEPPMRMMLHLVEIMGIIYEMAEPMNKEQGTVFKGAVLNGSGKAERWIHV